MNDFLTNLSHKVYEPGMSFTDEENEIPQINKVVECKRDSLLKQYTNTIVKNSHKKARVRRY